MMAIKKHVIQLLGILLIFNSCSSNDDSVTVFSGADFVRFSLVLDANDNPIEYPFLPPPAFVEVSAYEKLSLRTLKIPVSLTTTRDIGNVTVNFESINSGNISSTDFTILPSDGSLNFSNTKLTDTIFINQNARILNNNSGQIQFNLTNTSDSEIKLGYNRDLNALKSIDIIIGPTATTAFTFEKSREEILGTAGETFDFKILFPNGFIMSEIVDVNLYGITSAFDISIVQQPITNGTEISYVATVNENLPEDTSFDSLLNLIEVDGYEFGAITCFQVSKPIQIERFGNPAENFYNKNDQFFRLRGDFWRADDDNPGGCEWFPHNVFSVPVVVDADNPNAVQISGMDTEDISDDVYHHKYKIGFVSPNQTNGTTPFALQSLLVGESTFSPGLNLVEAIEFFPSNGNSTTGGSVSVISQKAGIIRSSDDVSFNIPLSGSGTYEIVDTTTNLWRIEIEVTYDFSAINGTIHTLPIVLYNQPGQPEPELSTLSCFEPIEL